MVGPKSGDPLPIVDVPRHGAVGHRGFAGPEIGERVMAIGESVTLQDLVQVGPGTLGGRYWRRFWHPVYRVSDLPAGSAKPLTILGEQLTLYRGDGGASHL